MPVSDSKIPKRINNLSTSTDAPARLKKELDKVLTVQVDIQVVKKALQATHSAINHTNTPPAAFTALQSLEKSHAELLITSP
jgi:hypothetical protein